MQCSSCGLLRAEASNSLVLSSTSTLHPGPARSIRVGFSSFFTALFSTPKIAPDLAQSSKIRQINGELVKMKLLRHFLQELLSNLIDN